MAAGDRPGRMTAAGVRVMLLGPAGKDACPLVWLHAPEDLGRSVWERLRVCCALACVEGADWNRDFSPWPAERAFARGAGFYGGAPAYLTSFAALVERTEQRLAFPVTERYLTGYSLAGLFAVYAWLQGLPLDGIGSFSGSLWYDGFAEWAMAKDARPVSLVMSVGDREKRARNARMAQVEACTRRLAEHWAKQMPVRFWLEKGGHFEDTAERMARGIGCLLTMRQGELAAR